MSAEDEIVNPLGEMSHVPCDTRKNNRDCLG